MTTPFELEGEYHHLQEHIERLEDEKHRAATATSNPTTAAQQAELDWYTEEALQLRAIKGEVAQQL